MRPDALTAVVLEELQEFVGWLHANGAAGFIGEFGWPDNTDGDGDAWNRLAETWFAAADKAGLWATAWATGEWWGRTYKLAPYYGSRDGGPVDSRSSQASVLEAHPSSLQYLRGVNVAGGSFGAASIEPTSTYSNANHGVYDVDYHYDGQATFNYLAGRGVQLARIDFRWERLQPLLGQPLDEAELLQLAGVVARARTANLKVVLDMHNYAAYYLSDGARGVRRTLGSAELPFELLADAWRRISQAFGNDRTVVGYGLMNEPANLTSQYAVQTSLESWDDGIGQWQADAGGSEVLSVTENPTHRSRRALRVDKSFGGSPGYGHFRIYDNQRSLASVVARADGQNTLAVWVYLPPGTSGTAWQARLFLYGAGPAVDADTSTDLTAGRWTLVTGRFDVGALRMAQTTGIQVYANDVAGTAWIGLDDLSLGTELRPAEIWERASQAAVNGIRATGDRRAVMVAGYGWSRPQDWSTYHPNAWIKDPANAVFYEAHHYWDRDQSSFYREPYAHELAAATSARS